MTDLVTVRAFLLQHAGSAFYLHKKTKSGQWRNQHPNVQKMRSFFTSLDDTSTVTADERRGDRCFVQVECRGYKAGVLYDMPLVWVEEILGGKEAADAAAMCAEKDSKIAEIRNAHNTHVYVIHAKGRNAYKVGMSTNPAKRLADLQTACPDELVLLGSFPGTAHDETAAHKALTLMGLHLRNEWFQLPESTP